MSTSSISIPVYTVKSFAFSSKGSKDSTSIGRYVIDRYKGSFGLACLQAKADTGLWYARATGTGLGIEGEGATVELALEDMVHRADSMRSELERVYGLAR